MSYLSGLNESQYEAVVHEGSPLIVLAGAGSGKTKMLISRICHSVEGRDISPLNILGVTFTNKAAAEMRHRIEQLAGSKMRGVTLSTFHALGCQILRQDIPEPYTPNFMIYDSQDQESLIKEILERLNIDPKSFSPRSFASMINGLKNEGLDVDESHKKFNDSFNPFVKHLHRILPIYKEELMRRNACDFGDMLLLPLKLFENNAEILQKWQGRFPVVLVDEYQDTNPVQYKILQLLKKYYPEEFCVVGDEDQSIYKWRGADISNILNFTRDFPDAKVVKLEQNYRSTKNIIRAASEVIARNSERYDKNLWTDNFDGDPLMLRICQDDRHESRYVCQTVQTLVSKGTSLNEMVILYRTNAQSRAFEDEFLRANIPYQIVGGLRFYDRKEIKDLLGYFRFLINSRDSISFQRIINTPARGLGATSVERIMEYANSEHKDLFETCVDLVGDKSFKARTKLQPFVNLLVGLQDMWRTPHRAQITEMFKYIIEQTSYVKKLKEDGSEEAKSRVQNIEELSNVIYEFEETYEGENLLVDFLQSITLESPQDKFDETRGAVSMMTIHMAKGLEFPYVFIVGLEEGLFPSQMSMDESYGACEEERRLMYVALTRAKTQVYLSYAQTRRIYGQVQGTLPSRFIEEIPKDVLYVQAKKVFMNPGLYGSPREEFVRPQSTSFRIGQAVKHPTYGVGVIQNAEGTGDDARVAVYFSSLGVKRFIVKLANLELV